MSPRLRKTRVVCEEKKRSDATAAEIAAQAARETRSAARRSGVSLKVIREWKEGMTQEERERVIAEQKLTEEQVATLDATAHARALAEAAGDRTLTLEEEVVEINRQIEKLGEADEDEAVQMLDAELLAEEEAKRAEESEKREGAPRAAEETPQDGGGDAASGELDALRVRAAELDERLRAKGLRKAERAKISEELSGVRARMHELSGGNLVLFSKGEAAVGRPALSPTKAALRDRLLLKIARTAGIRVIREGTEAIAASAARAQGEARLNASSSAATSRALSILKGYGLKTGWFVESPSDYARLASQVGTLWHERGNVDAYYVDGAVFVCVKGKGFGEFAVADVFSVDVPYEEFEARRAGISRELANAPKGKAGSFVGLYRNEFLRDNGTTSRAENGNADAGNGAIPDNTIRRDGEDADAGRSDAGDGLHKADGTLLATRIDKSAIHFKREAFPATAEERAGIEREAKGKGAWLKAPNGEPTNLTPEQWVTVRTRAFKEWFGDWENDAKNASKVVDGNGEPLVVYHGTDADFTVFDRAKTRATISSISSTVKNLEALVADYRAKGELDARQKSSSTGLNASSNPFAMIWTCSNMRLTIPSVFFRPKKSFR